MGSGPTRQSARGTSGGCRGAYPWPHRRSGALPTQWEGPQLRSYPSEVLQCFASTATSRGPDRGKGKRHAQRSRRLAHVQLEAGRFGPERTTLDGARGALAARHHADAPRGVDNLDLGPSQARPVDPSSVPRSLMVRTEGPVRRRWHAGRSPPKPHPRWRRIPHLTETGSRRRVGTTTDAAG